METLSEVESLSAAIRGIIAFRFLSPEDLRELRAESEILAYDEGEPLIEQGEVTPHLYGILGGTVAVSMLDEAGNEVYLNSLGPGEIFGEAGLFLQVERMATVRAKERVTVIRLHRTALARYLRKDPMAGNKLLLVVIYSLLRKLKLADRELAYERKGDLGQDDIDAMVSTLLGEGSGG